MSKGLINNYLNCCEPLLRKSLCAERSFSPSRACGIRITYLYLCACYLHVLKNSVEDEANLTHMLYKYLGR